MALDSYHLELAAVQNNVYAIRKHILREFFSAVGAGDYKLAGEVIKELRSKISVMNGQKRQGLENMLDAFETITKKNKAGCI